MRFHQTRVEDRMGKTSTTPRATEQALDEIAQVLIDAAARPEIREALTKAAAK